MSYNLQIDETGGGSGWINVQGFSSNDISLQATILPLAAGNYYYFRYRALNAHGWGEFSPISFVLLANVPDKLLPADVTNEGLMVKISWQATPDNRNSPVFEYLVKVMRSDGTFITHPQCPGWDEIVNSEMYCEVTMESLVSGDFKLT